MKMIKLQMNDGLTTVRALQELSRYSLCHSDLRRYNHHNFFVVSLTSRFTAVWQVSVCAILAGKCVKDVTNF